MKREHEALYGYGKSCAVYYVLSHSYARILPPNEQALADLQGCRFLVSMSSVVASILCPHLLTTTHITASMFSSLGILSHVQLHQTSSP